MRDLKNILLTSVGDRLAALGFNKKKQQSFYRTIEEGWVGVHLAFIDHTDDFDITVDVGIRFNDVENLVRSKNNLLTKEEKNATATLGVELGNLSDGKQRRWSISSNDQILSVTSSILEAYENIGEPYLAMYSDRHAAYKLLSSDDKSAWLHCPFHATMAKKSIAMAKLLGKTDIEIQNQISTRRQFLESIKDFGLPDFKEFTNSIS